MTTWMAREIEGTPDAVERLLRDGRPAIDAAAAAIRAFDPRWVTFVARGTSDHVATYGRYLVETTVGLPAGLAAASVTTVYDAPIRWGGVLVIAISQSGRSPDVAAVVTAARTGGALTIAITNEIGSPLAAAAEVVLPCLAGPERAVAASKTYVTCLVALAALVVAWAGPTQEHLRTALVSLPTALRRNLEVAAGWVHGSGIIEAFAASERALITSRGYDLSTALEIAIKLQETAGIFADGMSTADLEHGPVALAGPDVPVLAIRPGGEMGRRVDGALERVRATGARPWIVGGQEAPTSATASVDGHWLQLPVDLPAGLAPAAFILPGQLLAEAVARHRGRDPDLPTGLTKVTLTH